MATTIYKPLFEVKLLHEFYLTDNKGATVFDLNGQAARLDFLLKRFEKSLASIDNDLQYGVPDFLGPAVTGNHLRLVPGYSGFAVFTRVNKKVLAGGTTVYGPAIKLNDDFQLYVGLSKKGPAVDLISNGRLKNPVPFVYYFSNDDVPTPKTFPSLSAGIPAFDPEISYEQGDLASFGPDTIRQFYRTGGTDTWGPVSGSGYANAADQLLVPWEFTYRLDAADHITSARFELVDPDGAIVRTFVFTNENGLEKLPLNFRNDKVSEPPLIPVVPGKMYTLHLTLNDAKSIVNNVLFFEADSLRGYWGVVALKAKVADPDFDLYAADGFLKTRRLANGTVTPAPVFEIRIKSRFTYWRYRNDRNGKLLVTDATQDFVERAGKNLVTKTPRPASYLPTQFKNGAGNSFHYLPNPGSYESIASEDRMLFTDIVVPGSKMFPVET